MGWRLQAVEALHAHTHSYDKSRIPSNLPILVNYPSLRLRVYLDVASLTTISPRTALVLYRENANPVLVQVNGRLIGPFA
jgi:hypothetical protein